MPDLLSGGSAKSTATETTHSGGSGATAELRIPPAPRKWDLLDRFARWRLRRYIDRYGADDWTGLDPHACPYTDPQGRPCVKGCPHPDNNPIHFCREAS